MATKQREPEDQSLIPLIQETERQAKLEQEQARARIEAEVAAAEAEAATALEQARGEIPLRMERRHREELARIQAGIQSGAGEQEEVSRAAESNFSLAVEAIVKAVWGGG